MKKKNIYKYTFEGGRVLGRAVMDEVLVARNLIA